MAPRNVPRSLVALIAVALLGSLTAFASPALASGSKSGDAATGTADVRVMQLNIRHGLSPSAWAATAQRATAMADIANFQEASEASDRAAMAAMLQAQGWGYWYPAKGGVENPITWNASLFSMVSASSVQTIPGQRKVTPARFINTVILRQNSTDRLIAVINTHTLNKGAPDGGLQTNSRTARLKTHLAMLRDAILTAEQTTPYVVATGDLNVNYMRDRNIQAVGLPTNVLGPIVNFDMPIGPTYGGNTELDYVMTPKLPDTLSSMSSAIVPGLGSDHSGVLVGFYFGGSTVPTPPVTPTPPPPATSTTRFVAAKLANHPRGSTSARRATINTFTKAIANAPTGSAIHVVTYNLRDSAVRDALLKAHQRGVYVQVVLTGAGLNPWERAVKRALGTDTSTRTWFAGCTSKVCRKVGATMAPTVLLVSQAGRTPAVRMTMNRYLDRSATRHRAAGRVTTGLTAYNAAFHKFFLLIS